MSVVELVNRIARAVNRPAVLEDRRRRMVAFSPQMDPIDEVRQETILRQQSSTEVMLWLDRIGVYRSEATTHVPANSALRMLPRVCIPVRADGPTLGHLWFIDAPEPMPRGDIEHARKFVQHLAEAWPTIDEDAPEDRNSALIRALITGTAPTRSQAARALAQRSPLLAAGSIRAIVIRPLLTDRHPEAVAPLLRRIARRHPSPVALGGVVDDAVVFLDHVLSGTEAEEIGALLTSRVNEAMRTEDNVERILLGLGAPVDSLGEAHRSYRQAYDATRIHDLFGQDWPLADWAALHAYRGVHTSWEQGITADDFHHGVTLLARERDGAVLMETLRNYLDAGGRAQDTAERLHVHRSSLYHRLARIEAIVGADLQNGVDRLGLHMALMLNEMSARRSRSTHPTSR